MPDKYTESPLEESRRKENEESQRQDAFHSQVEHHREQINRASALHTKASALEVEAGRFDTDPEFRDMVAGERAIRNIKITTIVFYCIIFVADLFLATPHVSTMFADKTAAFVSDSLLHSTKWQGLTLTSTPPWLRLMVGMVMVLIWLGITYLVKKVGSETEEQVGLRRLQPGQDDLHARLTRAIWMKRGLKAGYLLALLGAFSVFYLWDLQEAKNTADRDQASASDATADTFQLPGGEQSPSRSNPRLETGENSVSPSGQAVNLANSSLAVYGGLWCLHLCLILLPTAPAGREMRYSTFSRGKLGRQIDRIRQEEIPLSRACGDRVLATEDADLKRRLFTITEPHRLRINEVFGREILVLDAATSQPAGQTLSEDSPLAATPLANGVHGHNGNSRNGHITPNGEHQDVSGITSDTREEAVPQPFSNDEVPSPNWDDDIWGRSRTA